LFSSAWTIPNNLSILLVKHFDSSFCALFTHFADANSASVVFEFFRHDFLTIVLMLYIPTDRSCFGKPLMQFLFIVSIESTNDLVSLKKNTKDFSLYLILKYYFFYELLAIFRDFFSRFRKFSFKNIEKMINSGIIFFLNQFFLW
jgi:hypothetical protein